MQSSNQILSGSSIFISGGTGSFGKKFVDYALSMPDGPRRIVVFSRDEMKQEEMRRSVFDPGNRLRFFLGDVRDPSRVYRAMRGCNLVIHAAALKQVPAAEYNPFEAVQTNILGAQNVINSAIDCGVSSVVALSTDKAASPINLYGATKLCSDKLFVAANNIRGSSDIRFSVVRYGNVFGSRGSVVPFFLSLPRNQKYPVTHESMTRFNITLAEGIRLVEWALNHAIGGEILVPKIPSYRVVDLVQALSENASYEVVGLRPGEKIHEELIGIYDSSQTIEGDDKYLILPQILGKDVPRYLEAHAGFEVVKDGFCYNSGANDNFLTVPDIQDLIQAEFSTFP